MIANKFDRQSDSSAVQLPVETSQLYKDLTHLPLDNM